MYSKPLEKQEYKYTYDLRVDGYDLQFYQMGREEKDLLLGPLSYYLKHIENKGEDPVKSFVLSKRPNWENKQAFQTIDQYVFSSQESLQQFPAWYCKFTSRQIGKKVGILEVFQSKYIVENGSLLLVSRRKVCQFEN